MDEILISASIVGSDAPLSKLPKNFPQTICEHTTLGIDVGIGSCGLALLYNGEGPKPTLQGLPDFGGKISFLGVRAFDVPETKEKTGPALKNPERRKYRLMRRTTARRAKRMRQIRRLLINQGVLESNYSIHSEEYQKKHEKAQPWEARERGLVEKLTDWEWAIVLLHIAKHRGFKSNRKSDRDSKGKKGGTLQSAKTNHEALDHYETVAQMFQNDPRFINRKRNREETYTSMVLRSDLIAEVDLLFSKQAAFGNPHTTNEFKQEYLKILESQKPLQNPVELLEKCPFEPELKRGSKYAPSFEVCRFFQKLNTQTLILPNGKQIPFLQEYGKNYHGYLQLLETFGSTEKVTYQQVREAFGIPQGTLFKELLLKNTKAGQKFSTLENLDLATTGKAGSAYATHLFRKALSTDQWETITKSDTEIPDFKLLDEAAFALTFYEVFEDEDPSIDTIAKQLEIRCSKSPELIQVIKDDFDSENPTLTVFNGSVSTSTQCSRKLIPQLMKGLVYSEAMSSAGYRFQTQQLKLSSITNPIVQSVLREVIKQVVHLVSEYGKIPGKINVEIARDLGKSIDERNQIDRGIHKRTIQRNSNRERVAGMLGINVADVRDEDLLKYELYLEQGHYCPYCGDTLPSESKLFDHTIQIDHILPRSRSHDNSYDNKVLACVTCNHNKKNRTPYEWLGPETKASWIDFENRLRTLYGLRKQKRRNLLNTQFTEREDEFLSRNLNDTRYISRLVAAFLQEIYHLVGEKPQTEKGSKRRVFTRPGALTGLVRKAWGLENLKKDLDGNRLGDKHHAVDALVCACIGENQQQFVTALSQVYARMENLRQHQLVPKGLPEPWDGFRESVVHALNQINVSRRERRTGRGALHADTVYGRRYNLIWKRTALVSVNGNKRTATIQKVSDLESIRGARQEDVERNPKNQWFRKVLNEWINNGSPVDNLPKNPNGQTIQKIYRKHSGDSLREINRGWVTNGDMIRCDVFSKGKRYYFVPVYAYQIQQDTPPKKFIKANKPEAEWDEIDDSFTFEFSLWPNSMFLVVEKPKKKSPEGSRIVGYYTSIHRGTAALNYKIPNDKGAGDFSVSPSTSERFVKLNIDRLGRIHEIAKEQRTWRGKVCM